MARPDNPSNVERSTRIQARALAHYHDLIGPRVTREAKLMTPTTAELKADLLADLPEIIRDRIAGAIAAAEETLGDLKRRDRVTPHLHHVLRTGIRIRNRLIRDSGATPWYESEDNLNRVEGGINHDSKEDGRRKRYVVEDGGQKRYVSKQEGNARRMTTADVQEILYNNTGHTPDSPVYKMIDVFDKYDAQGEKMPENIYLQRLKDAGLGPDKVDDTDDNMESDNSRAARALRNNNIAEMAEAVVELRRSRVTTQMRFDFFRDTLTDAHAEDIEVHMATADLMIKAIEAKMGITQPARRRRKFLFLF